MPIQFTTNLPDVGKPTLGNGVEDEISVDWTDVINYGHYDGQFRETSDTDWLTVFDSTTVIANADSTTDWGSGTNASVSTVSNPSEDGTAIQGTTDDPATQGNRYVSFTPGTNDDLSANTHLRFWYYTDETAGTHSLTVTDGGGTSETVSFSSQLTANEGVLVELDLSNYTTANLANVDTYTWNFDGDGTGIDKKIYVDSVITGVAPAGGEATTSATVQKLEDGEEYEVRLRTQTEHVTGAWSTPVSIVTKFPGATNLSVDATRKRSVDLSWSDNSDNEDGFRVWRRDELDPARSTGFGVWDIVEDLPPNTTTYTDEPVDPNHDYEYYIEAYTEHSSADSATVATTTAVAYGPHWTLELRRADGEKLTIDEEELNTESLQWRRKPTAIASWSVEIPPTPLIEDWHDSEAYWWYNGTLILRGPLHRIEGYSALSGKGVGWKLKQGGDSVRYQSIEGYNAADDYITNYTPFAATVYQPSTNLIDQDKVVQDEATQTELSNLFSPTATDPFKARADDTFDVLQTCFTVEGRDRTRSSATVFSSSDYSDGSGIGVDADTEYVEWDITTEYTIPASSVGIAVRDTDSGGAHEMQWKLTLEDGTSEVLDYLNGGEGLSLSWTDVGDGYYNGTGWTSGDIPPGTHTLRLEATGTSGGSYIVDVGAMLYDKRFTYNFDNAVDADGYLAGPELYPDAATIQTAIHDDTYNIAAADVATTLDDVSGGQAIQVTNDGGTTWLPNDGTETNTQSISADFSAAGTVGTDIKGRLTLSRYGSRSTATPTQGFKGQTLDTWTLDIDTNSLAVIDDRRYTGNDFENLKSILDDAGMVMVPKMIDGSLEIEVFAPGDVTGTLDLSDEDVLDHDRVVDREGYGNVQTVFGAIDSSTGDPITATARSQTEIDKRGEVLAEAVTEPRLKSKSDVENQAAQLLAQRIASREPTGWVEMVPQNIVPGKEYTLDYGKFDSEAMVLQKVEYNDVQKTRLDFEGDRDVAQVLAQLRGEVKQTKDAFK